MSDRNGTAPLTCGSCRFWCPQPRDPHDLRAPRQGQCRRVPPQVVLLGRDQVRGPLTMVTYPSVPEGFAACGLFEPALALET